MTRRRHCFVNAAFWHLPAQSKFFGNNGDGAIAEWILKPERQVNITTIVDQLGFAKGKQDLGEPARGQGVSTFS